MFSTKRNNIFLIAGMLLAITAIVYISAAKTAAADASANANPVAHAANTNQGYMENCKEVFTAKECATGPGNNGEFVSTIAHDVNGPQ